jgi:hypothetical protein
VDDGGQPSNHSEFPNKSYAAKDSTRANTEPDDNLPSPRTKEKKAQRRESARGVIFQWRSHQAPTGQMQDTSAIPARFLTRPHEFLTDLLLKRRMLLLILNHIFRKHRPMFHLW